MEYLSTTIHLKATEQYFPVVLFIMFKSHNGSCYVIFLFSVWNKNIILKRNYPYRPFHSLLSLIGKDRLGILNYAIYLVHLFL